MRYDLPLLNDFCVELGFQTLYSEVSLSVDLGERATLVFVNGKADVDCLVGFADGTWHFHGPTLTFSDPRGHYIELDLLAILEGLASGAVLVCTRVTGNVVDDRWLTHADFNDEFRFLEPADHLLVRRAVSAHRA